MRPRVYIETTIPSYLTCRPSADPVRLGHEIETRQWWETRRTRYELVSSLAVQDECGTGDPEMAAARLTVVSGLALIPSTPEVERLAAQLVRVMGLPLRAAADATHVALSAVHGVEYLLTWNCKHLANPSLWRRIEATCRAAGCAAPVIITPGIFLEGES